ncbi:MAG: hypothetical protein JW804_00060 [Sedimentisphaerales bacterium]|nr:hypothetical protein [Sedimentisphaerales bacterium]
MTLIEKFFRSYNKLEDFLKKWITILDKKCTKNPDNQIKASYYIWARYSIAIRSFKRLCEPQFLPDLYVIARCCLEYDASLSAILNDQEAATDYLEFEKHAKANYLRKFGNTIDKNKKKTYENNLALLGVKNIENYKWTKWCAKQGGYIGLIEKYEGTDAKRNYFFFSELSYGSVMAMKILQNISKSDKFLLMMQDIINLVYTGYIVGTNSFLEKVLGPIITSDSEQCKKDFDEIEQFFG